MLFKGNQKHASAVTNSVELLLGYKRAFLMTIDVYMPLQKYSCKKKKTNEFEKHGHNSSVLAKGSNTFVIVITTDLF